MRQILYVVVSDKVAKACMRSGEVSYQREPNYKRVPAELIPPMGRWQASGFVTYCNLTKVTLMDNVSNTKGVGMGRRVRILHEGEPA